MMKSPKTTTHDHIKMEVITVEGTEKITVAETVIEITENTITVLRKGNNENLKGKEKIKTMKK